MTAREPKIAYVMLRNAHFGPRLAASVELCVRDLIVHSRYARTTMVLCPPVDEPFEDVKIATIGDAPISGNLGKAWSVARLLKRRGVDLAIVENHLPAATLIALASGAPVILHTHAYVKAPSSALDGAFRGQELRRLSGFAFVSEYALSRFRADFPEVRAPQRAVPNGLDMQAWSAAKPKDASILCVGRALRHKGHIEAMAAIARALASRPEWSARFMVSDPVAADQEPETLEALRAAAKPFNGRIKVDSNVPYAEVKAAWEHAAVGMVLTTGPEPFGRTALEAMASGAALLTSGRGGLAEICGPCAVTVEPSDADGIAAALGQLMDAPDQRADLARAARKRVEALFDIRAIARQMDDFIEVCLGEGHGTAQVSDPGRRAALPRSERPFSARFHALMNLSCLS
jgi:glycosyltransferase involved in cell wall biosynthesis